MYFNKWGGGVNCSARFSSCNKTYLYTPIYGRLFALGVQKVVLFAFLIFGLYSCQKDSVILPEDTEDVSRGVVETPVDSSGIDVVFDDEWDGQIDVEFSNGYNDQKGGTK